MSKFLEAALKYHDIGLSIIPLWEGKKAPSKLKEWGKFQIERPTRDQIIQWWTKWPDANIGIITGKVSNLFVADIDKYKNEYDEEIALQYFPDTIMTATATTPRGGEHLYFSFPNGFQQGGRSDGKLAIDFRSDGNYIVAPPSRNGNGRSYEWTNSIFDTRLAEVPDAYISYIKNNIIYSNVTDKKENVTSCDILLDEGSRDQTIFHFANLLTRGGAKKEEILFVLNLLAKQCNPPFPESEIVTKCHSAMQRAERKERNITAEVEDWVSVTDGDFSVTMCEQARQLVTKEERAAARKAISRLKSKGIIEKAGNRDGWYRRVETNFDFITFDEHEAPEVEYPVKLPLGLNDIAEISQGNIVLVAGEFNAGKTSFLLNVLNLNKSFLPIRYITSEMSKSEFKKRFASFGLPLSFWVQDSMTEYIKKSSDFHSVIKPDALNIIDYMEFRDSDYTKGAEYLTKIHDALTTGIAIVAVQKKEGLRMPRSGDMIIEKPRLAISLSKYASNAEYPQGIAEVLKCKMPKLGKVDGKKLRFELQRNGSKFNILNDWGYLKF
jgi:hypothetical protein